MSLGNGASIGQSVEEYKRRRFDRAIARMDYAQEPMSWVTINHNPIPLDENGEAIGGNPKALGEGPKHTVVQGKNITKNWKRRPDKFEHEIEDVIAAQGFDGHPKLADEDEFNAAVKAANGGQGFVAMRTYTAPSKEVADEYRRMLYDGKWYVDCSTGGAQYGQGMYCAADYTGKETKAMRDEMGDYIALGKSRARKAMAEMLREEDAKAYEDEGYEAAYSLVSGEDKKVLDDWLKLYRASKEPSPDFKELDEFLEKYPDFSEAGKYESVKAAVGKFKEYDQKAEEARRKPLSGDSEYYYRAIQLDPLITSNTEIMTLDPSAKIIKYNDAVTLHRQNQVRVAEDAKEEALESTLDEFGIKDPKKREEYKEIYPAFIRQGTRFGRAKAIENYEKLRDQLGFTDKEAHDFSEKVKQKIQQAEYDARQMDIGSVCALYGYDAINAEGHGRTKSYTVILNRTKCIFKRPKDWKTDSVDQFRVRRQARLDAKKGKIEFKYNKEGIVEAWRDGKLLGVIGTLGDVAKKSDAERFRERRQKRLDAKEDEGRWITTDKGHKVHLNEEGDPDMGNPKVVAYMEAENFGSKKKLNDEFAKIAKSGKDNAEMIKDAEDLLSKMRAGTKIAFPDSWKYEDGTVPKAVKEVDAYGRETWAVDGGNEKGGYNLSSADLASYMVEPDDNERPKVTSAARTEESRKNSAQKREGKKDPPKHKHDGSVVGNHVSDYKNEYVGEEDREYVKKRVENAFHGFYGDGKNAAKAGKVLEDEIKHRAGLRKTREQGCDGEPQTEDIYDVLRDVRPFGLPEGSDLVQVDSSDLDPERTKALIKEATDRFPTEWFEGMDKPVHIKIYDGPGRADYMPDMWGEGTGGYIRVYARYKPEEIEGLNVSDEKSDVQIANAIAHELGHCIEHNNYKVGQAARDYLQERTKDSEEDYLEPGYSTKADSFFSSYMGKIYNNKLDADPNATEITSVLVQHLGYLDPFKTMRGEDDYTLGKRDKHSLGYILGILGGL